MRSLCIFFAPAHPRAGGSWSAGMPRNAGAALMRCDGHAVCTVLHQMLAAVYFVVAGAAILPPLWRSFSTGETPVFGAR